MKHIYIPRLHGRFAFQGGNYSPIIAHRINSQLFRAGDVVDIWSVICTGIFVSPRRGRGEGIVWVFIAILGSILLDQVSEYGGIEC